MYILGLHHGHDASASLLKDGEIVFSVSEERLIRRKHYGGIPFHAVNECVQYAEGVKNIDYVSITGFPDLDLIKLFGNDELFNKLINISDVSFKAKAKFLLKKPSLLTNKWPLFERDRFKILEDVPVFAYSHHYAHACTAIHGSGLNNDDNALVITCDGAGDDGVSITIGTYKNSKYKLIKTYGTNFSLGHFYSSVTEALGWDVGDGEGTTMGLSPYGSVTEENISLLDIFCPSFSDPINPVSVNFGHISYNAIDSQVSWSIEQSLKVKELIKIHGAEDIAAIAQNCLEREILHLFKYWVNEIKPTKLVCAGGVFLNVKVNQKLVKEFPDIPYYVYPDAGDSGLSAGVCFALYKELNPSYTGKLIKSMKLGPSYDNDEIKEILDVRNIDYIVVDDPAEICAHLLSAGKIVAWFQGREECGPRALGGRSILYQATSPDNKDIINSRVKYRQPFRPFCPSMTIENACHVLENSTRIERYMTVANDVKMSVRGKLPAITHEDGTCRPQMVEQDIDPLFHRVLKRYHEISSSYAVINTSLNIKGEAIVSSPRDAIKCLFDTGIDALLIEHFLIEKKKSH